METDEYDEYEYDEPDVIMAKPYVRDAGSADMINGPSQKPKPAPQLM